VSLEVAKKGLQRSKSTATQPAQGSKKTTAKLSIQENRLFPQAVQSWFFVENRGESGFFALTRRTLGSGIRKGSPLRSVRCAAPFGRP
jgi:hypothetical protein